VSTVSSQALTLLNSDFSTTQAESFSARLLRHHPDNLVEQAVLRSFSRPATTREKQLLAAFLTNQTNRHGGGAEGKSKALADLCQMLMSANEFAYVE
jgi:hypothetical protein